MYGMLYAELSSRRKYHRKCTPCPEEIAQKWRDPRIKWICGAYQEARRSFKSLCVMHLRNCQDGTSELRGAFFYVYIQSE